MEKASEVEWDPRVRGMGLDVSLTHTGLVIVQPGLGRWRGQLHIEFRLLYAGTFETKPHLEDFERGAEIAAWVKRCATYGGAGCEASPVGYPQQCYPAVEGYAMGAAGRLASIGEATGQVKAMLLDWTHHLPLLVSPNELKKFATSKGNTIKEMMPKEVYKRWEFDAPDTHQADAFVLAVISALWPYWINHGNEPWHTSAIVTLNQIQQGVARGLIEARLKRQEAREAAERPKTKGKKIAA